MPVAAFKFNRGGEPQIDAPPPRMGQDTETVLNDLGYTAADIADLRTARVI